MHTITPYHIIDFWYLNETRSMWFASTPEFDQDIQDNYENLWQAAKAGQLDDWLNTAQGCLALCIVLDQFPLNMYRGKPESFVTESKAIAVSKTAIAAHFQNDLPIQQRSFLYMPLMHSENLDDQDLAVSLFEKDQLKDNLRFSKHHRELIRQFGRFPHRNEILGRKSTKNEIEYLNSNNAFIG